MNELIQPDRITVRLANQADREHIYRLRHAVYACELGQHLPNESGVITDSLDAHNEYFVAAVNEVILGFVSVTPPGTPPGFSLDKYVRREEFPELSEERLFEIRLLTVLTPYRGRELALLLMYAAFRWVESQGGTRLAAIGRREVLSLYLRVGLAPLGCRFQSGAVMFELLSAAIAEVNRGLQKYTAIINRLERGVDWRLGFAFRKPAACFHGGAFFDALGPGFEHLERRAEIINADVLDAWFPPSPRVVAALQQDLPWLVHTSPPTACEGMIRAIASARSVPEDCVLPGAGSSALIFLALRQWLSPESQVLILDPMYGEYAHVLEQVVRCRVDRLRLSRETGYRVDLARLEVLLQRRYDLVILVNPNSPTGQHIPRADLAVVLTSAPETTRIWIDETYVDFVGAGESLEPLAARSRNIFVCKSMSKVYALSGLRAAYLCGPADLVEVLRAITPPWAVSLPAQVAAVAALTDKEYYAGRFAETHRLREELAAELTARTGWRILPGIANFVLCHVPDHGFTAEGWVERCRARGLFLRDVGAMGRHLGRYALRIAVKDRETNFRMIEIIGEICASQRKSKSLSPNQVRNSPKPHAAGQALVTPIAAA